MIKFIECCSNIGGRGPVKWCDKPAKYFYLHNGSVCTYCTNHNYVCGEKLNFVEAIRKLKMPLESLDDFIKNSKNIYSRNAYVKEPSFKSLYVRMTERTFEGKRYPTLDLANIEVKKPGQGVFTALIKRLRETYPELVLFVECVHNERLQEKLKSIGFTLQENSIPPCFYMLPEIK